MKVEIINCKKCEGFGIFEIINDVYDLIDNTCVCGGEE